MNFKFTINYQYCFNHIIDNFKSYKINTNQLQKVLVKNMQIKSNIDFEDITRMSEIAEIYRLTKQNEKYEKYHMNIVKICDRLPKDEKILQYKIHSLNCLGKAYKSLETTHELLSINPYNIGALLNIMKHMHEGLHV